MMQEAVEGIEAGGKSVFTLAPSAAAKTVLQREGFDRAETVARLLVDTELQQDVRGQVLWIDEAGLLGSKAIGQLFELAEKNDCRIVLSGDKRQHGSVERGAILRQLEEEAGLKSAAIRVIQRQSGRYKAAVKSLSVGETEQGFEQLSELGWIREVPNEERYRVMAADYVESVRQGLSTLVISPTHAEGSKIAKEIRRTLRENALIESDERTFKTLANVHMTQAERSDAASYLPSDILVFHQNAKGYRKGQQQVVGQHSVPVDHAARFQVFHAAETAVAPGDRIRVTRNGKTLDGKHRLDNGALYDIKGLDDAGNIVLDNGWTVAKDYGFITHGYCVTSHSSQGRTVDRILIGQSSESFPASSREQFQVSCSRARHEATIYTDNQDELLLAVRRSDDRTSATERDATRERMLRLAVVNQHISSRPSPVTHRERELAHDR